MLGWENQARAQMSQFHDVPTERKLEHHQVTNSKTGQFSKVLPSRESLHRTPMSSTLTSLNRKGH